MDERRRRMLVPMAGAAVGALLAILVVLWVGAGFRSGTQTGAAFELSDGIGEPLPSVPVVGPDGEPVRLDRHRGRPMVVNVWYSTCPPCARELADFATVHGQVGELVRFVGVDPRDTLAEMETFASGQGVTYELFRDDGTWVTAAGVVAYPTTLFVDEGGTIVRRAGVLADDELRSHLAELFGIGP